MRAYLDNIVLINSLLFCLFFPPYIIDPKKMVTKSVTTAELGIFTHCIRLTLITTIEKINLLAQTVLNFQSEEVQSLV